MRGLQPNERRALQAGDGELPEELITRLLDRGLVVRTGACFDCGKPEQGCGCPGDMFCELLRTAEVAGLALRLDAAARALEGVSA